MMRILTIVAVVSASMAAIPAAACDMEGMFGYNHYSQVEPDPVAAEAIRETAVAAASANFLARHGMTQTVEATPAAAQTDVSATADGAPNAADARPY